MKHPAVYIVHISVALLLFLHAAVESWVLFGDVLAVIWLNSCVARRPQGASCYLEMLLRAKGTKVDPLSRYIQGTRYNKT